MGDSRSLSVSATAPWRKAARSVRASLVSSLVQSLSQIKTRLFANKCLQIKTSKAPSYPNNAKGPRMWLIHILQKMKINILIV